MLAAIEMHRIPLTGWLHRIGYVANSTNIKTASLYFIPALFLYMTGSDILDFLGYERVSDAIHRGVPIGALLLLVSTQLYSHKSARHQKAATLKMDY